MVSTDSRAARHQGGSIAAVPLSGSLTRAPRRTCLLAALVILGLATVSAGCIRVELGLTVHEDGSGRIDLVYAVENALADAFAGFVEDGDTGIWGDADLPPNASVEAYSGDGFTGERVVILLDDMARAAELIGQISVPDGTFDGLLLTRNQDDGWHFEFPVPTLADAAEITDADEDALAIAGLLIDGASYEVRVALPGTITDHNADIEADGTLVWSIALASTETRTLTANSRPESGFNVGHAVAGVGVLAVVLVAVVGSRLGSRRR